MSNPTGAEIPTARNEALVWGESHIQASNGDREKYWNFSREKKKPANVEQ
jgi:hypothetical protein